VKEELDILSAKIKLIRKVGEHDCNYIFFEEEDKIGIADEFGNVLHALAPILEDENITDVKPKTFIPTKEGIILNTRVYVQNGEYSKKQEENRLYYFQDGRATLIANDDSICNVNVLGDGVITYTTLNENEKSGKKVLFDVSTLKKTKTIPLKGPFSTMFAMIDRRQLESPLFGDSAIVETENKKLYLLSPDGQTEKIDGLLYEDIGFVNYKVVGVKIGDTVTLKEFSPAKITTTCKVPEHLNIFNDINQISFKPIENSPNYTAMVVEGNLYIVKDNDFFSPIAKTNEYYIPQRAGHYYMIEPTRLLCLAQKDGYLFDFTKSDDDKLLLDKAYNVVKLPSPDAYLFRKARDGHRLNRFGGEVFVATFKNGKLEVVDELMLKHGYENALLVSKDGKNYLYDTQKLKIGTNPIPSNLDLEEVYTKQGVTAVICSEYHDGIERYKGYTIEGEAITRIQQNLRSVEKHVNDYIDECLKSDNEVENTLASKL